MTINLLRLKYLILLVIYSFLTINLAGQTHINQIINCNSQTFIQNASYLETSSSCIMQLGNHNTAILKQTKEDIRLSYNSSNSFQIGDFNYVDISQIGNQNILFSYQMDDISYNLLNSESNRELQDFISKNHYSMNSGNNSLISLQNGFTNKIISLQLGGKNYISIEQTGYENNLISIQNGTNNQVTDFYQKGGESDIIIQSGINNTLNITNTLAYTTKAQTNSYTQKGSNLTLLLKKSISNSIGGMDIKQTGHDMNVVIDQSYFSFPMK